MKKLFVLLFVGITSIAYCQTKGIESTNQNPFRQLGQDLPTPNEYRTASGAPGHKYWQQQVDYKMKITLDDNEQKVYGEELITYHNNSPDQLDYLWLQLDQNRRALTSETYLTQRNSVRDEMSIDAIQRFTPDFDGGFKLDYVQYGNGQNAHYMINATMIRVDLQKPLKPGEKTQLKIKWWYNINNRMEIGGRSGYEYFEEDDNYLYTIAQFFPRLCVYNDLEGWQNKQFLGRGEFTLEFGDYEVDITVPADHLVAATGELQNMSSVLTAEQQKRYKLAEKSFDQPVIIANQAEAVAREGQRSDKTKTWKFKAERVRDFAFASSRKFIWDAMAVKLADHNTMAMSMYPKEGNPLWEKYSTKAVAHTIKWYSHYTFDYPYPVAWSIHAASIGMEYPMICFNFGRPAKDGTYSKRTKYGMIGVIIHEVGHNWFPMIVNSDERQWTWMDEGLNTYVQCLTEVQWERDYPIRRGPAHLITDYMGGDKEKISPIMTNSESIWQFGPNAYSKPATALNILRETVLGREKMDFAFKTYSRRWMFKQPYPADFFRSLEDASATDLDWFWRGWFYTNEHVDQTISNVAYHTLNTGDPEKDKQRAKNDRDKVNKLNISALRNKKDIPQTYAEQDTSLIDFYNSYDELDVTNADKKKSQAILDKMDDQDLATLNSEKHFYEIEFTNDGGLVMPIVLQFVFEDGTTEDHRIPAEIWRLVSDKVKKVFVTDKKVENIILDPYYETADVDRSGNEYRAPQNPQPIKLSQKWDRNRGLNEMQRAARENNIEP